MTTQPISIPMEEILFAHVLCEGSTFEEHTTAYGAAIEYLPYTDSDIEECVSMKGFSEPEGSCVWAYSHYPNPNVIYLDTCEMTPQVFAGNSKAVLETPSPIVVSEAYSNNTSVLYSTLGISVDAGNSGGGVVTTIMNVPSNHPTITPVPLSDSGALLLLGLVILGVTLLPKVKDP